MPTLKGTNTAVSADALATEKLRKIGGQGAVITFAAVGQTATDRVKLTYGTTELTNSVEPNLLADADAGPKLPDDVIVDGEVLAPGGELSLEISAVTAQINWMIVIKPL